MGGALHAITHLGESAAHAVGGAIKKITHGLNKVTKAQINQLKEAARYTDKMNRQLMRGQLGPAARTTAQGVVRTGDQSIVDSTSQSDAKTIIPVATAIVGAVNPVYGAALTAARAYAQGASPLQVAKQAGIAYIGSKVGNYAGSNISGLGAPAPVAAGVSSGANATTQGLLRGEGLNKSLREGAAAGVSGGVTNALFGSPSASDSVSERIARGVSQSALSTAARNALGVTPSAPSSSRSSGFTPGLSAPAVNTVASATPSGPANVTGGAVDITGSDPTQQRSNVWNKGSLKLKDALGA